MRFATDSTTAAGNDSRTPLTARLKIWNQKLHYYSGLLLLLFIWLFAFTGLLLNHSAWKFAEFWSNRQQATFEREIVFPGPKGDLEQARNIADQLGIRGEIEWTKSRSDSNRLEFRTSRPGHILEIKADFDQKRAAVQEINLNAWGVMRILHAFTGVRLDDARNQRDWVLTTIWAWTMDAVAVGLVLMILTGVYMWWEQRRKRLFGLIILSLGIVSCGLFCFGLRWFF